MRFLIVLCCLVVVATALNCYICNSLNQPECVSDFANGKYSKPCPVKSFAGMKAVPAVGCRVTHQYVNVEQSVVRECAYTGENVERKSNKGSLGVSRVYTQCSEPLCNSVNSSFSFFTAIFAVALYKLFA